MTQEDKELLLKDLLCGRLPYKTFIKTPEDQCIELELLSMLTETVNGFPIEEVKPYLRQLSSMTKEEKTELFQLMGNGTDIQRIDFYLSHHFDYRGLIEKGLALKAPEGMYN